MVHLRDFCVRRFHLNAYPRPPGPDYSWLESFSRGCPVPEFPTGWHVPELAKGAWYKTVVTIATAIGMGGPVGYAIGLVVFLCGSPADIEGFLAFIGCVDGIMAVGCYWMCRNECQFGKESKSGIALLMAVAYALRGSEGRVHSVADHSAQCRDGSGHRLVYCTGPTSGRE